MQYNRFILFLIITSALWALPRQAAAQDFLLEACLWQCSPGDSVAPYVRQIQREAAQWKYAGFTGLWLPEIPAAQAASLGALSGALRAGGIEPLVFLPAPAAAGAPDKLLADAKALRDRHRIRNLHIGPGLEAWHYAALLNVMIAEKAVPDIIVADPGRQRSPAGIATWINAVYDQIPDADAPHIFPRALDHPLREALRKACTSPGYDVRQLFSAGLRDATTLTGFHTVTYVNASFLPESEALADPMLAYSYILSNNQLGLPMVQLDDYRNAEHRDAIEQLMEAHRKYVFNSTEVEYLNRPDSERRSVFRSAAQGADEERAILFQMEGRNTPAAQASGESRDVLVAINFSDAPLRVVQALNPSNLRPDDVFYDVLGGSDTPELRLNAGEESGIPFAVYIELPPRSYSMWVQGETGMVLPGEIRLSAARTGEAVELSWESPGRPGIRFFELERSANGGIFERLAELSAMPGAQAAVYLFLDETAERGKRYAYRVKALKTDDFFYSPVASVEMPAERTRFEMNAGKTPDERVLRIRSNVQGPAKMTIYDKAGQAVTAENFAINTGEARRLLLLEALPRGVYVIEIKIKGERVWAERLVRL
ncbi:MAG: hypothetical protein KF852_11800 [Saprospiraceae bacterium]|nr:hypothetical protein [Saprospiraceae bacterium]